MEAKKKYDMSTKNFHKKNKTTIKRNKVQKGPISLYADKDEFPPPIIHGNTPKNISIRNTYRENRRNKDLLLKNIMNKVCSKNDGKIEERILSTKMGSKFQKTKNNFNKTFTQSKETILNNSPTLVDKDLRIEKGTSYEIRKLNNSNETNIKNISTSSFFEERCKSNVNEKNKDSYFKQLDLKRLKIFRSLNRNNFRNLNDLTKRRSSKRLCLSKCSFAEEKCNSNSNKEFKNLYSTQHDLRRSKRNIFLTKNNHSNFKELTKRRSSERLYIKKNPFSNLFSF